MKFYADIEMYTNNFSGTDPESYMANWACSEIPGPENQWLGNNIQRSCVAEYDAMVAEMSKTAALGERARLAKAMNDIIVQNHYMIPLIWRGDVSAHANTLKGVRMNAWGFGAVERGGLAPLRVGRLCAAFLASLRRGLPASSRRPRCLSARRARWRRTLPRRLPPLIVFCECEDDRTRSADLNRTERFPAYKPSRCAATFALWRVFQQEMLSGAIIRPLDSTPRHQRWARNLGRRGSPHRPQSHPGRVVKHAANAHRPVLLTSAVAGSPSFSPSAITRHPKRNGPSCGPWLPGLPTWSPGGRFPWRMPRRASASANRCPRSRSVSPSRR